MSKLKKLLAFSVVISLLALLPTGLAVGQTIDYGKMTGTIVDDSGQGLPGVNVEISSPALIAGKRTSATNDKGVFVFLNLPIGIYKLTASLQGFKSVVRENLNITAGRSLVVDLMLEAGAIEESVTVIAASPVVDAKSSTIMASVESELLDKLPTSRDAFYDLALSTPGMVSQGKDGSWLPSPSAYGSTSNENVFLINGVNTTNPRLAAAGSLVAVNYNAVEEVRVIALGSKAEYGNFSGVAIDVTTKSGSNVLHGNAAVYSILGEAANNQPAEPDIDDPAAPIGALGPEMLFIGPGDDIKRYSEKEYEVNFTVGGPIIRDRIWFYGGFDYIRSQGKDPFWAVPNRYWGRFGDIKLSAEPWANHRAWLAYHYENNDGDGWTWNPHWDNSMTYGQASITHSISAQWQWMPTSKTILTAKYLGFWRNDKPHIPDDYESLNPGYINWWKWNVYGINGAFPYVEAQKSSRNTLQADVSYYAENFLGEHDIKFGVQYTQGRGNWQGGYFQGYVNFVYPMRWTQNINYMQSWYGDTGLIFYNRQTWLNPFLTVRTSDSLGLFVDDQWTPAKRLTINFGLRFDTMSSKYGVGKVYEQPSTPDGMNDPPPVIRDRQSTDNIFDLKNIAPRIGITYALTKDLKTVFRASFGRYFLPINTENLRRFGPDMPDTEYRWLFYKVPFDLVDANHNFYVDPDEVTDAARLVPQYPSPESRPSWWAISEMVDYSWQLNVQEGLKNQYTDQFTINLERELFADFSAGLTYIYKYTKNLFVQWPINEVTQQEWEYERVPYTTAYGEEVQLYGIVWKDYNGDGVVDNADVGWVGAHIDSSVRNMPEIDGFKPKRSYQGLQFTLKKKYSNRWQMMASVLIASSDGMAARTIRQDLNVEGPMTFDTLWLAGLNQTLNSMEGPLPFTQKFEIKISGSYLIPYVDVDLGFRFRYNSGRPIWPLEVYPMRQSWGGAPDSVIATGGDRIVSINPTDPWYLPEERVLDLRLDKAIRLGSYGNLRLALDILNVFNESAITNAGYGGAHEPVIGRVSGVTYPSRKLRFNVLFQF